MGHEPGIEELVGYAEDHWDELIAACTDERRHLAPAAPADALARSLWRWARFSAGIDLRVPDQTPGELRPWLQAHGWRIARPRDMIGYGPAVAGLARRMAQELGYDVGELKRRLHEFQRRRRERGEDDGRPVHLNDALNPPDRFDELVDQ